MNSTITTSSRTWKATAYVMQDGAVLERRTHTITVQRQGDEIVSAIVDGQPVEVARAAHLLVWAKSTGSLEIVGRREPVVIGKAVAYRLHIQLATLGFGRGFALASEVLCRPVDSLAALSPDDAREVLSFACGSVGIPTFGLAAA